MRREVAAAARVVALTALVVGATVAGVPSASAAGSSRAVVNIGGSNHVVSFNGSVSGIGALQMTAGVETISYGGQGVAVCSINGVGNPAVPGECLGEVSGRYWSYWRAGPGAGGFSYSGGGAGSTSVTDGAVEGWNFGNGPPPFSSFCAVAGCAPPPPPPVTTPPTAAPPATSGGSGAASTTGDPTVGDSQAAGGKRSGSDKKAAGDGKVASTGSDGGSGSGPGSTNGSGSGTSGDGGRGAGRDGQQASGPLVSRPDDGGSPWGVAVAAGAFAALGAGGFVLRKRRRLSVPLE